LVGDKIRTCDPLPTGKNQPTAVGQAIEVLATKPPSTIGWEWTSTPCGVQYAPGVTGIADTTRINREHRMNTTSKWTMALALLAGAAYGQVPSTNDTSDGFGNTGMGTDALFSLTPNLGKGQGLYEHRGWQLGELDWLLQRRNRGWCALLQHVRRHQYCDGVGGDAR
jgi:hypothetical protein